MALWFNTVPAWVLPLVSQYAIPDNAQVFTGVDFGGLDDAEGQQALSGSTLTAGYPGLIPDFTMEPEIEPTTTGVQYLLKCKKGVGFYGVTCDVTSFDEKRVNKWTFPLVRRKFGFLTLSRAGTVAYQAGIDYQSQYHFADIVQGLASNYDDDFQTFTLQNEADKFVLNQVDVFLYPTVEILIGFLPTWEVWALRFFQTNT